ncbi:twin-arginine translocase subunit TatC [Desulfitobacterium hafniense]|nr:twin-arginine translocase subunit TatC [Desulfitobacterium hafniense]
MPLTDHLRDLRKVLVVAAYAIAGGTVLGWFVSDLTFAYLARPVSLLGDITFITTTPMEPMLVKIKVSVIFGGGRKKLCVNG